MCTQQEQSHVSRVMKTKMGIGEGLTRCQLPRHCYHEGEVRPTHQPSRTLHLGHRSAGTPATKHPKCCIPCRGEGGVQSTTGGCEDGRITLAATSALISSCVSASLFLASSVRRSQSAMKDWRCSAAWRGQVGGERVCVVGATTLPTGWLPFQPHN